jgi:hypothetical protein
MRKVNANDVPELAWSSPKGTFGGFGKQLSEALGRDPRSYDLLERHPFDGPADLVMIVVADNPIGEAHDHPGQREVGRPDPRAPHPPLGRSRRRRRRGMSPGRGMRG